MDNQPHPYRYPDQTSLSDETNQSWVITYLDTFTLLLGFFIILSGLANFDLFTQDRVQTGIFENAEGRNSTVTDIELLALYRELHFLLRNEITSGRAFVTLHEHDIRLGFRGSSFFDSGSATILSEGQPILEMMLLTFKSMNTGRFYIDVEGHSDRIPIARRTQSQFPSNWELSASRAGQVVRYFVEAGYPSRQLKASGYADTFPLVEDFDVGGRPLPDNNDINRRIVFRLYLTNNPN
jgi:chemotaxis protein MotB